MIHSTLQNVEEFALTDDGEESACDDVLLPRELRRVFIFEDRRFGGRVDPSSGNHWGDVWVMVGHQWGGSGAAMAGHRWDGGVMVVWQQWVGGGVRVRH
jgi:hypothetical protein